MALKELRQNAGLLQEYVAKRLDVDQGTLSHWENGKTKPYAKYRKKLAKLYGVTVEEIEQCLQ